MYIQTKQLEYINKIANNLEFLKIIANLIKYNT